MRFTQLNSIWLVAGLLLAGTLSAQEKPFEWYTAQFPKEPAVKLLDETNIVIEFDDKNRLRVWRAVSDEKLLLTNTASSFRERQIVYNSFFDIREVEATAYIPKGNGYSKKRIKEFRREKIMSERVFHDDLKAVKFEYPDLRQGAKIDLHYKEDILNPFFLPRYTCKMYTSQKRFV